jgi:hypothetical protein
MRVAVEVTALALPLVMTCNQDEVFSGGNRLPVRASTVLDHQISQLSNRFAPVYFDVRQQTDAEALFQFHLDLDPIKLIAAEARHQHGLMCNGLHRQTLLLGDHHPHLVEHAQVQSFALCLDHSSLFFHCDPAHQLLTSHYIIHTGVHSIYSVGCRVVTAPRLSASNHCFAWCTGAASIQRHAGIASSSSLGCASTTCHWPPATIWRTSMVLHFMVTLTPLTRTCTLCTRPPASARQ